MAIFLIPNAAVVTWLFLAAAFSLTQPYQQPPTWPDTFTVFFHEEYVSPFKPKRENDGVWYYDFANDRARFDHFEGQSDPFCALTGLKLKDNHTACSLIFASKGVYVNYTQERQCCSLCGPAEGCTMLRPNWLAGSKYLGNENISGMTCQGWVKPGTLLTDRWYQTEDGVPCRQSETSTQNLGQHNMTFNNMTYKVGPIPNDVFNFPKYCHVTCPTPFKPTL